MLQYGRLGQDDVLLGGAAVRVPGRGHERHAERGGVVRLHHDPVLQQLVRRGQLPARRRREPLQLQRLGRVGQADLQEPQRQGPDGRAGQRRRRRGLHPRGPARPRHPVQQTVLQLRWRHDVGHVAAVPEQRVPRRGGRLVDNRWHHPQRSVSDDHPGALAHGDGPSLGTVRRRRLHRPHGLRGALHLPGHWMVEVMPVIIQVRSGILSRTWYGAHRHLRHFDISLYILLMSSCHILLYSCIYSCIYLFNVLKFISLEPSDDTSPIFTYHNISLNTLLR